MMRPTHAILTCLFLVVLAASACTLAEENTAGLFDIGSSARGLGLGGAFSALADDEGAVVHSPAALGWGDGLGVSSLFVQQFGGAFYGSLGIALPYVGAHVLVLDSGAIPTDEGTTRFSSQGVAASVGVPIGMVGVGARWRYYRVSAPTMGSGWALDPAILAVASGVRVNLIYEGAVSVPVVYRSGAEETWERSLRLGASVTLEPSSDVVWSAALEASGLFTTNVNLALGLETWIGGLGARVGFDGVGPTFGLSLTFDTLQIDWAFATRSDLGNSHRVALTLRF